MSNQDGNQPYAPYAPPTASVEYVNVIYESFIPGGRSRSVRNGIGWISSAWNLFKRQPKTWALFGLVYSVSFLLLLIPFVGSIFFNFVIFLLIAGVIYSCDRLQREGSFFFGNLFAAFSRQTGSLLILCLIILSFALALGIIAGVFLGIAIAFFPSSSPVGLVASVIIGSIVVLIGGVLLTMAVWFAPALVMMHNISAFEAMKMSFSGCLKNILPGLVFFIVMGALMFLSMIPLGHVLKMIADSTFEPYLILIIPLGLGLLVTMPLFFICYYTSYRSVFFDENSGRF